MQVEVRLVCILHLWNYLTVRYGEIENKLKCDRCSIIVFLKKKSHNLRENTCDGVLQLVRLREKLDKII